MSAGQLLEIVQLHTGQGPIHENASHWQVSQDVTHHRLYDSAYQAHRGDKARISCPADEPQDRATTIPISILSKKIF